MNANGRAELRVLHVMEATIGGTRRHLIDVAREQRRLGLSVDVIASAERVAEFRRDLAQLANEGVRVVELPMVREIRPGIDLRHLRAIERELVARRPDVVHTHSSKAGVLGRLASLELSIGARVHTPHTFAFLFHAMFGATKRRLFRQIERGLADSTSAVIAVSESEGETIRASGVVPPERVRVVPNGIDIARWVDVPPISRAELGVPDRAPLLVVAGLLNVAKGQDVAIRALAERELASAHLVLAGNGEEGAEWERLARELGVAERTHFLGWRDDVPRIFAAADVVLLPSRWEAMPYAVLEAMAAEKPVVATAVDGARELVAEGVTGRLVALEDPRALALATAEVLALDPRSRALLGVAGRERVLRRYSSAAMARGLVAVYREVA
ncbi:MAG: glycosyltransferase family 4 protein [Planctomycetes bacterium]|nr:glycosyltransferase family 4 protein [Planctomycetota bacterium]